MIHQYISYIEQGRFVCRFLTRKCCIQFLIASCAQFPSLVDTGNYLFQLNFKQKCRTRFSSAWRFRRRSNIKIKSVRFLFVFHECKEKFFAPLARFRFLDSLQPPRDCAGVGTVERFEGRIRFGVFLEFVGRFAPHQAIRAESWNEPRFGRRILASFR